MGALSIYLLKASAILALFLFAYQALLRRETLFRHNRFFLLSGLLAAPLLPLVTIRRTVTLPFSPADTAGEQITVSAIPEAAPAFPWESLLLAAYLLGATICALILFWQLWKLRRLIASANPLRRDKFVYIPDRDVEAPFSFFRYIFYNPDRHGETELPMILEHERAHGEQYHSVDILLGRLVAALLWINPLIWWYQKTMVQNLEYLADARAIRSIPSVREYQYTLLRVSGNTPTPALANAFYSSLIKKRIIMLQQTQS
ncbi:MAG TPA: M56 family metallopeptidase, partial [Robiginitalea sp.]|nr:M56 family metallopeptidase [Robiginitalea sp.]